jgi:1,4-dihydroxy-6-naphthoate synthase
MPQKLTLGFSPCPNDTFIFDALVNGKIDTGGLEFEVLLEDVQTLNKWAQQGRLDVSKISYGVLPDILSDYAVLSSGGALGMGVGPLLIGSTKHKVGNTKYEEGSTKYEIRSTKYEIQSLKNEVENNTIAIPGENTTAHFLFSQAFPDAKNKVFLRFDEIEKWVSDGNGLGVIIHENRFTYAQKGLHQWADLGQLWEQKTGLPIPLGGIVAKRTLPKEIHHQLDEIIQKSITFSWKQYPALSAYITNHSQEMEEDIMRMHIELYVNDFSFDMTENGKLAILKMMESMGKKSHDLSQVFAS